MSGLNSGRFLDAPEFAIAHDKGNEQNVFDRVDLQITNADSLHFNFGFTRSWFQTPNSLDAEYATAWSGLDGVLPSVKTIQALCPGRIAVGPTDQRSKIQTFNIAPSWTRLLSNTKVFTLGGLVRRDNYNYYPSPIRSPILARPAYSASPWARVARLPMPGFAPTSLM